MIKKIYLLVVLLASVQLVQAQKLTDNQVMEMIVAEKSKGADDSEIAKKMLLKGATPTQIRNVVNSIKQQAKSKDEAVDYGIERGREEESAKETMPDELEAEVLVDDVYGRNLFNNKLLTFEPAVNIPTPADYTLGAGDKVIIDIWGASQQSIEGEISPDGYVVVSGFGPIKLSGLTVEAANEFVKRTLGESYNGSSISLSLGATRSVKIEIVGDVVAPGSYTMSAFSTLFNALYTAGGIGSMGTLRDIKVFRNGKEVSKIDVYDYIVNGNNSGNIRLQDNDLIIVGPYDAIVNLQGKVKRPMKYEMKAGETLSNLMDYSGGFMSDAYTKNIRVVRKSGREYSIHTVEKDAFSAFKLVDGDSIFVDEMIQRFSNMVEIKGAVFHPGMYQMDGKIRTLLDLIDAADGLREDAFLARTVMLRRKADRRLEVLAIDLGGILDGTSPDVELCKEDVITIPSSMEMRGQEILKISGEVNNPGIYEYAENMTLEDLVLQAGGLTNSASVIKIDVYRRVYNPRSEAATDTITDVYTFALKDGFVVDGDNGFVLEPYDEVNVRKSPAFSPVKNVEVKGCVNFEGYYAKSSNDFRLSNLIEAAGGLKENAYVQGARLFRKVTPEEREHKERILKKSQIQLYEDKLYASDGDKDKGIMLSDSILNLKLQLEGRYPVAIDLKKAVSDPNSTENILLHDGDLVVVPEYSGVVKISGEVGSAISVNYKKGKNLKYYIKNAGGYSENAKKKGVYVVYMNGGVKKVSNYSSKDIKPGCEIIVPRKQEKEKFTTAEIMAISSSVVSLSTIVVALINLLK